MGYKFNPFSGNFDLAGGGGDAAPFAGQVDAYADLPLDSTAALNSRWLVKNNSGTWPFSTYKQAGIYIRVNTVGASRDTDYQFVGTLPSVMNDNEFLIYDDADATKNLKFQLSGITTGTTSTLTVPASGTIARTQDFASPPSIGSTTRNSGAFTTLVTGDTITAANATASPPTGISQARGLQFGSLGGTLGNTAAIYGSHPSTATLGIGIQNNSAGSITQVAAFTSTGLSVNGGTVTASAPVLDLAQTWNNSGVTFTGMRFNAAGTSDANSAAASALADFQTGGTSRFQIRKSGTIHHSASGNIGILTTGQGMTLNAIGGGTNLSWSGPFQANGAIQSAFGGFEFGSATNTVLQRDGADHLVAFRAGANPQDLRIYGQYTLPNNFERLSLKYNSTALAFQIGTEKGTSGSARALEFQTDGVTRMTIAATGGNISMGTSALFGITGLQFDSAASFRFASAGIGTSSDLWILRSGSGIMRISTGSGDNDFNRLQFGGTTNAYPALKRSSTTLQVRLADDTAFAPFECAGLTLNGDLTASTRNIVTDTTTGTKIGTATDQKIGFWNATPVIQQSSTGTNATGFTANGPSNTVHADSTFTGNVGTIAYSISDIVKHLKTLGLIAS